MEMGAHEDAHLQARSINRSESQAWRDQSAVFSAFYARCIFSTSSTQKEHTNTAHKCRKRRRPRALSRLSVLQSMANKRAFPASRHPKGCHGKAGKNRCALSHPRRPATAKNNNARLHIDSLIPLLNQTLTQVSYARRHDQT